MKKKLKALSNALIATAKANEDLAKVYRKIGFDRAAKQAEFDAVNFRCSAKTIVC